MDGNANRGNARPRFFHRELTWLQFNQRVQAEADNPENPPLERAKFLAIVTSNLDEFIQVRYHRLLENARPPLASLRQPCGLTHAEILRQVNKTILRQQNQQYLLYEGIHSELHHLGAQMYPTFAPNEAMTARVKQIFLHDLMNRLKPIPWGEEIAPLSQKKLHLLIRLQPRDGRGSRFVTLSLPTSPRLYALPSDDGIVRLIRQEDVVKLFLPSLFPEERVEEAAIFRILRNQDFPFDDQGDVATLVREMLMKRRTGDVMRLEAEERMSAEMLSMLTERFALPEECRYRVTGPLDLNKLLMSLYTLLDRPDLKYRRAEPLIVTPLCGKEIFTRLEEKDWLLYHPYHSFEPVVNLLNQAADDPDVCSVKTTLYRVGSNSPVVRALIRAAENGKQVTVLFEARARFDEENNLALGDRLRRAGCHVIFGLPRYKTHSKTVLVCRMENGQVKRYLHLGTGNYHDGTAKLYTDFGLLTANPQLGEDAARFFYALEGNGPAFTSTELVDAPTRLKPRLLDLIGRERANALIGKPAGITAKMNSLLDPEIIEALYAANCAGVPVELIVRGICTLVPGVPGRSEHIRVTSIVGRHLEHARVFRFENGGEPELYLSSADWMPRNLDRRVELMFPIKDAACKSAAENVLTLQLLDNCKSWQLNPDGSYKRKLAGAVAPVNAQETLLADIQAVYSGFWFQHFHLAGGMELPGGKADNV